MTIDAAAPPANLDPHLQYEFYANSILSNVYEGLIAHDAAMNIVPALAERWESPDETTWIFHLRPGVRFHDGRALTAGHVIASLDRAARHKDSARAGFLVTVRDYVALDARTLRISTRRPAPMLLYKLAFIFIAPGASFEPIVEPIGTGPYRLVESRADGGVRLERFEGYWGRRPRVSKASIVAEADPGRRLQRLLAGEVDLSQALDPHQADRVARARGLKLAVLKGLRSEYLQLDVTARPFDDVRVRRAMHLALDRTALARQVYGGYGRPTAQMVGHLETGYAPDLGPPDRDLETARRLMREAGYANGFDATLEFRPGRQGAPLKEQLAEIGIRLTLAPGPWSEMYHRQARGQVRFYLGSWISGSLEAAEFFVNKVHTRDPAAGYGVMNGSQYSNPEMDRLIEDALEAGSLQERHEILARAMRLLIEDLPVIPLYSCDQITGLKASLAFRPRLDGRLQLDSIEPAPGAAP